MNEARESVGEYGYFTSSELTLVMPMYRLSSTQRDVWDTILGWMEPGGLVRRGRQDIADRLGIHPNTVSSALSRLIELRLLWRKGQRLFQVNPHAAYKSKTGDPEEWLRAVADLSGEAPSLFAPTYTRRPPRRRDDGRAKNRHLRSV
ncbi:hypothetical protein [Nocardiopsis sp. NPDC055824]